MSRIQNGIQAILKQINNMWTNLVILNYLCWIYLNISGGMLFSESFNLSSICTNYLNPNLDSLN